MPRRRTESETRRKVRAMKNAGATPREIAGALGLSTQAVYQHIKRIEATPPPEERAS